ncbi:MAG TPA: response regulator [Anaerolineae bacterium]|jgi:CheY-like chemotaxis protein|nr:response regulator [Anaerolineae bacterium]
MIRILHIEDNLANQILVQRVLESEGYGIVHAADGRSGIQFAQESEFDLILIDMGLPDLDGQTVVTMLQQMPKFEATPIVAITAWPAEQALMTAERYGLSGCILKPIDVKEFPGQIAAFLPGNSADGGFADGELSANDIRS